MIMIQFIITYSDQSRSQLCLYFCGHCLGWNQSTWSWSSYL